MIFIHSFARKNLGIAVAALLVTVGVTPAFAQQGVVSDWSNHHVKFSNPGTKADAEMNGRGQEWQRLTSSPRYQAQQIKRGTAWASRFANAEARLQHSRWGSNRWNSDKSSIQRDWFVNVATPGNGTAFGAYPAEYGANFDAASCSDFVVYPVDATGSALQPNLVGFTNLYSGNGALACTTLGKPSVKFAYYVGTTTGVVTRGGTILTSPVLSEDGTKVAFVANANSGAAYFFVVTLSNTGTVIAPTELNTAGGTGYTVIALDHGAGNTRSSPYIDFTDDIAYVGDSSGYLHKITGVFNGTPAEVTTAPWPVRVVTTGGATAETLTGPIYDSISGRIFVGAGNGNLYCVVASSAASCGHDDVATSAKNPALTTSSSGPIYDAPVVDPVAETVYSEAVFSTSSSTTGTGGGHGTATSYAYAVLMQDSIASFGTAPIGVNMGTVEVGSTGTTGHTPPTITLNAPNLYSGDFDNTYYNSTAGNYAGNLYFCGNADASSAGNSGNTTYDATPELYEIGFNSSGTITTIPTAVYGLASNSTLQASACSPLTEFYNNNANAGAGADYLFLSVTGYGTPSGCGGDGCVMSFTLPTDGLTVGTVPTASLTLGGVGDGTSGIVIDNVDNQTGSSQIYFGNLQNGDAIQASQAALQ